jgi:hypothetical protein
VPLVTRRTLPKEQCVPLVTRDALPEERHVPTLPRDAFPPEQRTSRVVQGGLCDHREPGIDTPIDASRVPWQGSRLQG